MRKDKGSWSVYLNRNHFFNWGIGINYYHEYETAPFKVMAKICQIDLLFFNITITRWAKWI